MMLGSSGSPRGVHPPPSPPPPLNVAHKVNTSLIYLSTDFKWGGKLRKTKYLPRHDTDEGTKISDQQLRNMKLSQII